jgi:GT2 family glycosyltransferase
MKLGIPTLVCYDLLEKALASAELGTEKPTEYVIVDNGTRLFESGIQLPPNTRVIQPKRNIGVAAAWNLLLDDAGDDPIVISNDDVLLGRYTFEEMHADLKRSPFACSGWALFGQTPECTREVGFYDENFWPAYYEDADYGVRLARAGIRKVWNVSEPVNHAGCWTTANRLGDPAWLREGVQRCGAYFEHKWGAMPGAELYEKPFNGHPPSGWRLRK